MSGDKKPPIIKKVIKKGHGGHHGGSWKVAYADFVTAMMAFFLVMWLLAISSEAGRQALADYFNELTVYEAVFNGGLPTAFDGSPPKPSVLDGGCFSRDSGEEVEEAEVEVDDEAAQAQMASLVKTTEQMLENLDSLPEGVDGGEGSGDAGRVAVGMTAGEQQFSAELQAQVLTHLGDVAASQVLVEKVKGGLRIQIVDKEGRPMFQTGGPGLTEAAKETLAVVGSRIATLPNQVSIEGHTDALTFAGTKFTNWELSAARASAARVYLAAAGLADERITSVSGYACSNPLPGTDPNDAVNRRISIMIWDEDDATPQGGAAPGQVGTPSRSTRPALPQAGQYLPKEDVPLEELENQIFQSSIDEATTPDLSTVGPALPFVPQEEN